MSAPATTLPIAAIAPKAGLDDFDWQKDADCIVLREQRETACYVNPFGEMVIRQRCWPDDDAIILIAEHNITEFFERSAAVIRRSERP